MAAGRGAGRRSAKNADAPHGALQVLSPLVGRQRQRVAMGRAIVRSPQAFLMDEPLSSLDAKLRVQMRTTVSRIQSQLGTTMVYVTHDQTEAMALGDRVAVMRGGVIQQVDTPKELYRRPANLFVAGFLGSPAMNFLPVHPDDNRLRTPMGDLPLPAEVRAKLQQAGAGRGLTFSVVVDVLSGSAPRSWPISASRARELEELAADSGSTDVSPRRATSW
jgi:multiple sugar transport system ATP-binding protein